MKKQKGKSRATHVAGDMRKRRLQSLLRVFVALLLPTLYLFYCLSGLYIIDVEMTKLKEQIVWCLLHPLKIYNDKSLSMVFVGGLLWMVLSFTAYSKSDHNRMPGNEFGSAKWGEVREFNEKYAAKTADGEGNLSSKNKVLSQNVRFRYDSDTLRNNNVFVVGGSGAGKTAFFLTPNLLSLHDCNIYTDPKGSLVEELGAWLSEQRDTKVYTLNLCEMEKSMHFNPFLYIRSKSDVTKLVTNLIQNTNSPNIKNSSQDPFWEKAERMFLESLFLYVWMECPKGVYNQKRGRAELLQKNWKTILYLLDEAQFVDADTPPKLDLRMEELAKKKPDHPAVKAYQRYRGGPDETIRSVIMTVNARMQPFDNEELLEIFSSNDIPLDEFGVGIDGDKKTKSNLFIIIPDDDDTFNFVPGMVYTLLFQELYRQARFFGGKLPMDVGFWLDEMANIKMPNNFDKILATCRSRGVYCVPILQSLAQLKTLFADGAWEGIVGNCDTFIYLGGNEASTYEYVSKLLGKWTIDKRTSGESKGSSGSYSQNYDVLGRELMLEYELRLLPDDECIIFVRGENPIRDKKWFPWEHEQYLEARKRGVFNSKEQQGKQEKRMEECEFLGEESLNYLKLQKDKNENIRLYELDAFSFMMMELDEMEKKIHSTPNDKKGKAGEPTITAGMIQSALHAEKEREEAERKAWFVENFDSLTLLDIYASEWIGEIRRNVIRDLLQAQALEEVIKSIIRPEIEEGQVLQKKKMWMEMEGRERIEE